MLGGYKKHENHQNDQRVQEIAAFAIKEIAGKEGTELELVKIQSVSTQVVAGKNYKLVIDAATKEQKVQPYEATVYEPLGGQDLQLTEHKALDKANAKQALESSAERHSGALLGGYKELESQDMDAREAAEFATEQLSAQANSSHPWQLNKVLNAKEKVACGKLYSLDLEVSTGEGQGPKVLNAEVSRSIQNKFELHSWRVL